MKVTVGLLGEDDGIVSAKENIKNRNNVAKNWHLGPEKTSIKPDANGQYWTKMGELWNVPSSEARRRLCANCEYFNNTPDMQAKMEAIPLDSYDMDGGGRGYCTKFEFVCHNLRTCQAWEEKPFEVDE